MSLVEDVIAVEASVNQELSATQAMQAQQAANRRQHARLPARWPVKATLANKKEFDGRLENVSVSGVLLQSRTLVSVGARAHLKMESFVFGVKRVIDAVVEFRHVSLYQDSYRIGCQFIRITEQNKRFLQLYVDRKNPHDAGKRAEGALLPGLL